MIASRSARPTPRPRASAADVHALPGDAAVDRPRRVAAQGGPADDRPARLVAGDEPAVGAVGMVEVSPVGRLALERRVVGGDALGVDPPDRRPVVGGHRLDPDRHPE